MRVPKRIYDNEVTIKNQLWKNILYIIFTYILMKNKHKTQQIMLTIKQIFQDQVREENYIFFSLIVEKNKCNERKK